MKRTNLSNPTLNPTAPVQPQEQRDDESQPAKPSRKALGKRRAIVDEDSKLFIPFYEVKLTDR
jgi:hypothetical protein